MEGRVLGFGVDPDGAADAGALGLGEVDHLLQGRNGELPVLGLVAIRHGLLGAQRLDLGEREVAREPVGGVDAVHLAGGLARSEFGLAAHIRGAPEHRLVAGDQHAVLRDHEVRLDEVRPLLDGELVGLQRVLRAGSRWRRDGRPRGRVRR
jgi:hypothetical protein